MKNQFRRLVGVSTLILCGVVAGIPIGFVLAPKDEAENPQRQREMKVGLGHELKLGLPESFFADLPVSDNGRDRLVSVDTFSNPYLGEVVLPVYPQPPKQLADKRSSSITSVLSPRNNSYMAAPTDLSRWKSCGLNAPLVHSHIGCGSLHPKPNCDHVCRLGHSRSHSLSSGK